MEDLLQTTKSWPHLLLSNARAGNMQSGHCRLFPQTLNCCRSLPQHSASLNRPICSSDEGQSQYLPLWLADFGHPATFVRQFLSQLDKPLHALAKLLRREVSFVGIITKLARDQPISDISGEAR